MFRSRLFSVCLLAAALAGCRAQVPAAPQSGQLDRKIELLVRSQLSVPNDWSVKVGERTPSTTPGFDTITLSFTPPPAAAERGRVEKLEFSSLARQCDAGPGFQVGPEQDPARHDHRGGAPGTRAG